LGDRADIPEITEHHGNARFARVFEYLHWRTRVIYVAPGVQAVHTTPNGGLGNGPRNDWYPTISFEWKCYPKTIEEHVAKPLYLIGWIGGYEKGSIMHVGWQFPHVRRFSEESLNMEAFSVYKEIAKVIYHADEWDDLRYMDSAVRRFITQYD
jgi:hypothetical protein